MPATKSVIAAPTPTPAPAPVPLPNWNDAASVQSYITAVIAGIVTVVTALHPGFHEPTVVQAVIPSVSAVVAGVVTVIGIVMHRSVQKAVVAK